VRVGGVTVQSGLAVKQRWSTGDFTAESNRGARGQLDEALQGTGRRPVKVTPAYGGRGTIQQRTSVPGVDAEQREVRSSPRPAERKLVTPLSLRDRPAFVQDQLPGAAGRWSAGLPTTVFISPNNCRAARVHVVGTRQGT